MAFVFYSVLFLTGLFTGAKYISKRFCSKLKKENTLLYSFCPQGFECRLCKKRETGKCSNYDCQYLKYQQFKSILMSAQRSVSICVALVSNDDEINSFIELHHRGIQVKVVVDKNLQSTADLAEIAATALVEAGIKIKLVALEGLMHHKFILIDDQILVNGSMNHTKMGFFGNYENLEITNSKDAIIAFKNEFQHIWSDN